MTMKSKTQPHGLGSGMPHYRAEVMTLSFEGLVNANKGKMPMADHAATQGTCQ